ncbi:Golgin subfamily A member 7/ERF4 family-domain-containing protein [Amylocarpus encephaloides]|uniref:Ras modification protein ERF4 n=1 Tax=Amylocarpus encephaloides TaxID=45428 RepID=A0A9P8C7C7_9HELO|nr:Golgin subfamily A member 7/ERF4 family-domain-containing protein [Amylocarpus encephaloides]
MSISFLKNQKNQKNYSPRTSPAISSSFVSLLASFLASPWPLSRLAKEPRPLSSPRMSVTFHITSRILPRQPQIAQILHNSTKSSLLRPHPTSRVANAPTASQARPSRSNIRRSSIDSVHHAQSLSSNAAGPSSTANPRLPSPTFQPPYPSPSPVPTTSTEGRQRPQVRVTSPTRWSLRNALIGGGIPEFPSPFRNRSGTVGTNNTSGALPPARPSPARLWNPTNSTPRPRKRTVSQGQGDHPAVIAIPLSHPDIGSPRERAAAGGSYPLLTLSEQRQSLHLGSTRASLQVERSGSSAGSNRVSLPRSVSIDVARSKSGDSPTTPDPRIDKGKGRSTSPEEAEAQKSAKPKHRNVTVLQTQDQTILNSQPPSPGLSFHRTMSPDLERGPDSQGFYSPGGTSNLPRHSSNVSLDAGIGPALSSENSSVIGSEGGVAQDEWGPQHPCFPHMNAHVPLSSDLYQTTRIIRIRRDWMVEGDLAPTFSNLYPEILDPAGVTEQDFRTIIEKVNQELVPAFNPWGARNIFDAAMGLLTGWIWDDLGFTAVKSRLRKAEQFLEEWNNEMEKKNRDGQGSAPKIVPLRRTGYMNLDIQVPDPEISYPTSNAPDDRTVTGVSTSSQRRPAT